jgi:hypothetical protein
MATCSPARSRSAAAIRTTPNLGNGAAASIPAPVGANGRCSPRLYPGARALLEVADNYVGDISVNIGARICSDDLSHWSDLSMNGMRGSARPGRPHRWLKVNRRYGGTRRGCESCCDRLKRCRALIGRLAKGSPAGSSTAFEVTTTTSAKCAKKPRISLESRMGCTDRLSDDGILGPGPGTKLERRRL